jgi:hypothetical protein
LRKEIVVKNGTVVSIDYFDVPASCLWTNVTLADFGYPVYALWFYIFQKFQKCLAFHFVEFGVRLMKVVTKTRHAL